MDDLSNRKTFLVLEDDPDDAVLIRRAFTNSECRAFVCRNTSEAKAYLLGAGMYAARDRFPFPKMFVTDLRLGEESGVLFVQWMRTRREFKTLPIVVVSGVATPKDVVALKKLGVFRVIQKPSDPLALQSLLLQLSQELCLDTPRAPSSNSSTALVGADQAVR